MCRIKGTIDELQFIKKKLNVEVKHANKRDLLFKKHLKMAGLYEEQEKQIDPALKQLLDELNSYAVLIEAGELPLKELTLFIYKLDCLDIKDNSLKNAVKDILSELKSRLNQMDVESKKNKKHIKTIVKRELEIKNYRYIDLKEFGEIITLRNSLKANVSILEELKKQSTYSSANLKRQIRRDVIDAIGANINSATNGMQRIIDQKQFYDESIDGKEYIHGLSTYNEMQDLMLIRENELENYVTSNKVKEVFLLENAYGFARSDKYAFSIEEVGNEIKLGIHIQNIQPYLSEKMYTFLYNELFKKLSDDMLPNNYVNDVCSKYYTFKVNEVRPTIAYTLTFDKNFKFKSFDIESCDTILRKQTDEEVNILDGIYVNNDIPSYDRTDFFENLLLREFLKYVQKNNIPVMFYGKPVDDYNGKYNKTKKKCAEKMGDKLVKFSEAMGDVDRKTYDNICYKWYKNEKRYHFSLDIEESFRYYVKDLKILEPFSFQGYNLERLINLLVLNKNNLNQEQLDYLRGKLVEEQKRFIATFNGASKYIDIDSFIDIVGKETGKVKSNKKR